MDYNVAVIGGRLAATPELMPCDPDCIRLLVDVRSDWPTRRHDLVPVVFTGDALEPGLELGDMLWAVGSLRRRFSSRSGRSRIELVAYHVERQ